MSNAEKFFAELSNSIADAGFQKLTLGGKRDKASELKNVFVKRVEIKKHRLLSFTFRYNTRDEVKNFGSNEAVSKVRELLASEFLNADLFLPDRVLYFVDKPGENPKLRTKHLSSVTPVASVAPHHDKQKFRYVKPGSSWLHALGITSASGQVKADKQHKYRQIDRYVRIMAGIFKDRDKTAPLRITDMGSGKGYLSFALYEYLTAEGFNASLTGIELREELVEKCNAAAAAGGFDNLKFMTGSIADAKLSNGETLIALHACDTATDDAIAKGIKAGSEFIVCAPCCHKQVRKEIAPANALKNITSQGILLERQAEIVTDTIRALILEAHGYSARVFEFIDEADTPKNVMIAANFTGK